MATSLRKTIITYAALVIILPSVIFAFSLGVLCAIECTALPWYSFVIGPVISLVVLLAIGMETYIDASKFDDSNRRTIRMLVVTSIVWAPIASGVFYFTVVMLYFFIDWIQNK